MKYIDLPFTNPPENLAFEEIILEAREAGEFEDDVLIFWESNHYFVVVGYANRVTTEVNREACQQDNVSIYRRSSGGGTVVQGPGCLNYSLVLRINEQVPNIAATNRYVMAKQLAAVEQILKRPVQIRGHTDLAVDDLKFSGNAQRRRRDHLIFHGSFLLNFDLSKIEAYLRMPSQEPDYRQHRKHQDFLMNLAVSADTLKKALRDAWQATETAEYLPLAQTDALVQKYSSDEWNLKF